MKSSRRSLFLAVAAATLWRCGPPAPPLPPEESVTVPASGSVTIYVEAPRAIAGPILKSFTEQSGIEVHAFYQESLGGNFLSSVEAAATEGKADVFWTVTPLAALEIARRGLALPFRPLGARPIPEQYRDTEFRWIGFAVNPRVIIYNSTRVARDEAPQSIDDLVRPPWAGKGAASRIGEGTAAFQAAAMFTLRGPERARAYYDGIASRHNWIGENDTQVAERVSSGQALWGVCDLDVAIAANRQGAPLHITYPRLTPEAFVIPHVAGVLRRPPHPEQARGLVGYLLTQETAYMLGQNDRALITLLPDIPKPDWLPTLAAFNITRLDNQAVYQAYRDNLPYFTGWGGAGGASPAR